MFFYCYRLVTIIFLTATNLSAVDSRPFTGAEKRPKASNKEKEWVEVPDRKDLRKKKKQGKNLSRTQEKSRRARSEAVLIKPAEGMRYASILRGLKKRVNPDELGATV